MIYRIGARLRFFVDRWNALSNNKKWARSVVRDGYSLQFWKQPKQQFKPKPFQPASQKEADLVTSHVRELLKKQAIYKVDPREARRGFYSSMFLVKKPHSNAYRPVLNLKRLNYFTKYQKFKMESLKTVRKVVRKGDWLTKVDLSDAYFHVPIAKESQKWLQFEWHGQTYRYTCLPFGLQAAPRIFTKVLRPVVQELRRRGVRLIVYLDDILIIAKTQAQSLRYTNLVKQVLKAHGFCLNDKKSVAVPSQRLEFLGALVDTQNMCLQVPQKKLKAFLREARRFLSKAQRKEKLTIRQLAGLVGKLQSMSMAMEQVRLHLNGLLKNLKYGLFAGQKSGQMWTHKVYLNHQSLSDLQWWTGEAAQWNGKSLLPKVFHKTVYTDASNTGWGGIVVNRNKGLTTHRTRGFWLPSEELWSINQKEMEAVKRLLFGAIRHLSWKNLNVEVYVDNITTLWYLNKAGGKYDHLVDLAAEILKFCHKRGITLVCRYVNTKENLEADRLSRWKNDRSDWRLNPQIFRNVEQRWGPHSVDWTATRHNRQVERFCSWGLDDQASYVDVLKSMNSWENGYSNPPFGMIGDVIRAARRAQASLTLVAPVWSAQPWWPDLLEAVTDFPYFLPQRDDLFLPPQGSTMARRLNNHHCQLVAPEWRVAAWRLSFSPSARRDFRRRLSERFARVPGRTVLCPSTSHIGRLGWLIARGGVFPL